MEHARMAGPRPWRATGVALGLAAVLTLLPMALLRRPQLLTLSQPENT